MNKTTSELKTQTSCQEAKRKQLYFVPAVCTVPSPLQSPSLTYLQLLQLLF